MALLRESNFTNDLQSYKPNFNKISFQLTNAKSALINPSYTSHLTPGGVGFDGKRIRKSITRKTVDIYSSLINYLEERKWNRDFRDIINPEPDSSYSVDLLPPEGYINNPINSVMTKFIRAATNKIKCPIFSVVWTPDGRRLITGASSGEFTLWSGLHFNFETILQAHDTSVRSMIWSHNDQWMVTADHGGYIKYWQSNMNNVKMYQAHKDAIRGLSFSPTDHKLASCADDGTVRIWDFERCEEEKILRGHGSDVKCIDWHPTKSLLASGSKDNQQPIKLWDPKSGQSLATIHSHKGTVMSLGWNPYNGNWLLTGSRDQSLKLFDIRNFKEEVQSFRGHKKDITSIAWHPIHESLFVSGSADGTILYWNVGNDRDVGGIEQAHDSIIWCLSWHPLGHILVSGSNDHTTKFWTRNRPGDLLQERETHNALLADNAIHIEEFLSTAKTTGDVPLLKQEKISETASLSAPNPDKTNLDTGYDPTLTSTPSTGKAQKSVMIPGLDFFDGETNHTTIYDTGSIQSNDNHPSNEGTPDTNIAFLNNPYPMRKPETFDAYTASGPSKFGAQPSGGQRIQDAFHVMNAPQPNQFQPNQFSNFANPININNNNIYNNLSANNNNFKMMAGPNRFMQQTQFNNNNNTNNNNNVALTPATMMMQMMMSRMAANFGNQNNNMNFQGQQPSFFNNNRPLRPSSDPFHYTAGKNILGNTAQMNRNNNVANSDPSSYNKRFSRQWSNSDRYQKKFKHD